MLQKRHTTPPIGSRLHDRQRNKRGLRSYQNFRRLFLSVNKSCLIDEVRQEAVVIVPVRQGHPYHHEDDEVPDRE